MLEKTKRLNYLYDFYHTLLTPKQQKYIKLYYIEDFSLVEIAELAGVSRQAIFDNIKRTEHILETYESKLLLYEKFEARQALLKQLQTEHADQTEQNEAMRTLIQKLKALS